MRNLSPQSINMHFHSQLRRKHIERLFRQKRHEILQQEMENKHHLQIQREDQNRTQRHYWHLFEELDNINNLATLYNELRQDRFRSVAQGDIEIFLDRVMKEIQYWISLRELKQSEGFLFLLVLIFKTLAALTREPDRHICRLIVSGQFLGVDERIKDLLCVGQLKAISC